MGLVVWVEDVESFAGFRLLGLGRVMASTRLPVEVEGNERARRPIRTVRVAYLSTWNSDMAYANLAYLHGFMDAEETTWAAPVHSFDMAHPYTLGIRSLAYGHHKLVAAPTHIFFTGARVHQAAHASVVVLVPADELALKFLLRPLRAFLGERCPPVLIQLDTDRWDEEAMERIEAAYGPHVVRANLRTGHHILHTLRRAEALVMDQDGQ